MGVRVETNDGSVWEVFTIGSSTGPDEWLVLAKSDGEERYRRLRIDLPLANIPVEVLAAAIERADVFAPERFDAWAVRPSSVTIQPPARYVRQGELITGIGQVAFGCQVHLKLRSDQAVTIRVTEQYGDDIFAGLVEDVDPGSTDPRSLIGRTLGFHRQHVWAIS